MSNDQQLQLNQSLPQPETIEVNRAQLAELIRQNKAAKIENAKMRGMLNASVNLIAFVKNVFFGGKIPTDFKLKDAIKIVTRMPKIMDKFDEQTINSLKENIDIVKITASEFLSDDELKLIS